MKYLLVTIEYPPDTGGVGNYYFNLAGHWPKESGLLVLDNKRGRLVSDQAFPKWLPSFFTIRKKIKAEKIGHIITGHILPLGIPVLIISKLMKIKYSVVLHGMDLSFSQRSLRKKILAGLVLRHSARIICANSHTAKQAEKITGRKDIETVNPGVSKAPDGLPEIAGRIKQKYGLYGKTVLFGLGRLVSRKGFDQVIRAMPKVSSRKNSVYYFIAGDGPDRQRLEELADSQENIVFLGKISEEEKWGWLAACDIFIMPSRDIKGDYEGFGIVYLEANTAGKPVIAGRSGGVEDAVVDGLSGILVDPENENEIAEAVIKLLEDSALRKKLGRAGQARAAAKFNWPDQARSFYEKIEKTG